MPRYVAFLRAINVGGHTVRMERLRELFAALGFTRVETFIASGNVIFDDAGGDTDDMERRIERRLAESLGYEVITFVRTVADVSAVAAARPFGDPEAGEAAPTLMIGFLKAPPGDAAGEQVLTLRSAIDDLRLVGREVYWLRRTHLGDSRLSGGVFEKALAMPMTIRNATTVRKLAAKYGATA